MLHHNSPDKLNSGLEGSVVYRAAPGTSRVLMGVGPVSEENQQNYRIQQAVNRYNNVPLPLMRPSTLFKCNLLKSKTAKPVNTDQAVNVNRTKPETRYAAGHFPTVILGKANMRQAKRNNVLSHLRANEPVLPISRFLDDTSDKYTDLKNTRSVLDVLQDLSRKRIHGKDEGDDVTKRRCKGLGGDQVQEGESFYRPLFVSKAKNNHAVRKDQTTQTQAASALNGTEETAATPEDPKSELRKKLARRNNEIFASLSSSINSVFFPKRKRVQSQIAEKEIHSAKKQKVEETTKPVEMEMTVTAAPEKPSKKVETSVSPPAKDRMMGIYFDLKNAGEVKKNVLETLQKSPGQSQFQRSFECPPETVLTPAEKTPTGNSESSPKVTFSSIAPAEITSPKLAGDEAPKKQPTLGQSPVSSVSFKFLDTEKSKPEKPTETDKPFSFGSLKPSTAKDPVSIPAPSFKFTSPNEEPKSTPGLFNFGESTPEASKSSPPKTTETKTLTGMSLPGTSFSPNLSTAQTTLPSYSPPTFNFGTKKPETSQPSPVPPAELPKFNFGTTTTTTLFQATSTPSSTKPDADPPAFSFDLKKTPVDSKPTPAAPSFSFGSVKTETSVTTTPSTGFTLSFGSLKPATNDTKTSSEETKTEVNTASTVAFGQTAPAPFTFGQTKPESAAFSFGATKTAEPSSGFSFGKSDPAEKPSFSFGPAESTESVVKSDVAGKSIEPPTSSTPSFSFSQTQSSAMLRSGFSFSQAGTTGTATTATSGFSFNKNPTESTNVGFSFSGSKPFSFGNKTSENVSVKVEDKGPATTTAGGIFSFASTSTDVKPVQFGAPSAVTSETGKESFGSSIFAGSSASTPATTSSSVFSRLGKTVNVEIKTDTPGNLFNTPTGTDSNTVSFGDTKTGSVSLFKSTETGVSSIFGQTSGSGSNTAKATFSFGNAVTTAPPAYTTPTNPTTTAALGQASGFNFGAKTTAVSTASSFSFAKTTNAQTTPAFSFGSTPFGASASTPTFGSTTPAPAFGASTTTAPTFGSSAPAPAFGASTTTAPTFGSTAPTPSAFGGSTTTAPTFGSTAPTPSAFGGSTTTAPTFGSTAPTPSAFGSSTTTAPTFGSTTTAPPAFGSSSTAAPSFGSTTATPAFGSSTATPSFGSTTNAPPAFGSPATATSTPTFGSTNSAPPPFGSAAISTASPAFGSTNTAPLPFGSSANSSTTPKFGSTTTAPSAFGSAAASMATPSFGSTTAAPPAFGSPAAATSTSFKPSTTAPAFGASTPAFGTVAPAFGATTTTAPPAFGSNTFGASSAFGGNSTTPSFGTNAFGSTGNFGNPTDKPAFGSGTPGFPTASSTPTFGAPTATPSPFGENNTAFGSNNFGTGFSGANPGFGSAPSSAGTPAPFNFGAGNATSTPTFKFGANQNAPFTFGSSNNSGSGFNFSASPAGAFSFGSNTSGFNQTPTPGATGFQPGFGQPAPTPFSPSATFSIGTASTQPPRRHMARSRRRP